MDRKPAAKIDPIKTSHLGKRLREPESEPHQSINYQPQVQTRLVHKPL